MRTIAVATAMLAVAVGAAAADDQNAFIVDVTHAYYAKALCQGLDIVYENFVTTAQRRKLDPILVDEVRDGVVFLNTDGLIGPKPRKKVMDAVVRAEKMIKMDQGKTVLESWCNFRGPLLLRDGFVVRKSS